jgi:primase-polymerase (primpol)-like protein
MRAGSGVVGIDLDDCIAPDGTVEPNALRIVEMIDSYAEISPSGTGLHVFALADLPVARRSGPVELYGTSQYLTVTGCVFGDHHLMRAAQAEVEKLHAAITPPPVSTSRTPPAPPRQFPRRLDREIIDRASSARSGAKFRALWNGDSSGYSSGSEADAALICMLLFWTDGDRDRADALFRQSGLMRDKWNRQDYRERTFAAAERVTS